MARVNHKLVKQRLNEKRSKISDMQFFTSGILSGHFEDIAAAQTQRYRYNRRVRVVLFWEPNNDDVAWTDNDVICINCGHKLVTSIKGREQRYRIVCGLFTHELGHLLFTDFLAGQNHLNGFANGLWFPKQPIYKNSIDHVNEKDMWGYVKESQDNLKVVQKIAHDLSNIIEDGYIENRLLVNYPGKLGKCLTTLRKLHFETIPTVTQLKEKEVSEGKHIFESILQNLLSYAKFGEIKYGEEPLTDERIQTVFGLLVDVDEALLNRSSKERLNTVNIIILRCWNYIKDFCEICKQRNEDNKASGGTDSLEETVGKAIKSLAGNSVKGKGSSKPMSGDENGTEKSATAKKRAKTANESKESETETKEEEESGSEENKESDEAATGNSEGENGASDEAEGETASAASNKKQSVSEEEGGRIPLKKTSNLYEPEGGTVEINSDYEYEDYENAASDIERMLDKMAEKEVCRELENERLAELNEFAQNIAYGNIHQGVPKCVNRIRTVDETLKEKYNKISAPLIGISKRLQKSIMQQIKDKQSGGKMTGLMFGRRLDTHTLHRNDGKVFSKNSLPTETPQLAVGLLLDESGSMSNCDRATYARATAIILYDFCKSLGIPIMVYGHSTRKRTASVELYSYAEFESYDSDDKYRLMDISARNANRDGAALRYVAEALTKRSEDVKLLILVSDGQPADYGYMGTAAEEDLRGIKQEYKRKGVLFVAAAIGNDKQNIERIYGDSFLDITDLNQLPGKLTSVVKRYIRV